MYKNVVNKLVSARKMLAKLLFNAARFLPCSSWVASRYR